MAEHEFGSDFGQILDNFTFSTPQIEEFGEDFKGLLGGDRGLQQHQTLGGADAVYYPTPKIEDENNLLAILEERYHIEQLRENSAGWQLEKLLVRFNHLADLFQEGELSTANKRALQTLESSLADYKAYLESVRLPLEYQTRVCFIFFLSQIEEGSLDSSDLSLILNFPSELNGTYNQIKIQNTIQKISLNYDELSSMWFKYAFDLDFSTPGFMSSEQPDFSSHRTWLTRISGIIQEYRKTHSSKNNQFYPWILRFLMEIPALAALNPRLGLKSNTVQESTKINLFPAQRLFTLFRNVLLEIPKSELESVIVKAMDSEDMKDALDALSSYLGRKVEESNQLTMINSYGLAKILRNSSLSLLQQEHPNLPSPMKLAPMLPLRPIQSLPDLSETYDLVNSNQSPSLKIVRQTDKAETNFLIKQPNEDVISRYFYNQLQSFSQGFKILQNEGGLELLDMMTRGAQLNVRQEALLVITKCPEGLIPTQKEKELAQALGMADWPLEEEKLSSQLNLPLKEIKDPLGGKRAQGVADNSDESSDSLVSKVKKVLPLDQKELQRLDSINHLYYLELILGLLNLMYQLKRQQTDDPNELRIAAITAQQILLGLTDANIINKELEVIFGEIVSSQLTATTPREAWQGISIPSDPEGTWDELMTEIQQLINRSNLT